MNDSLHFQVVCWWKEWDDKYLADYVFVQVNVDARLLLGGGQASALAAFSQLENGVTVVHMSFLYRLHINDVV